jgi:hypothetical protein
MFVRFRQTARRLQASLTETRRQGGKVRHEHVAGLGSVSLSLSAADRIAFWTKLHQRLDVLSSRVDAAQRGAILTAIHARIPMPTAEEREEAEATAGRTKVDRRYDAMLTEIVAHGGAEMAKRAERRTIKLIWDYLQILKRAPPPGVAGLIGTIGEQS